MDDRLNITDEAVVAAAEVLLEGFPDGALIGVGTVRAALAAAAPFLIAAAQGLDEDEVKSAAWEDATWD